MKTLSIRIIPFVLLVVLFGCNTTSNNTSKKIPDEKIETAKTDVKKVLKEYKNAIENLSADNTIDLFAKNSAVFESGGLEGTYKNYVEHHLKPELKLFKSFKFTNYKVDVSIDLPYAFSTETYVYTIVVKADKEKARKERTISQKGVATAVLKNIDGKWKILKYHSSARRIRK
ncbi:MAG TPA: DUF4440 domain-containing protein [Ignavibacteria bacterium]|nr:DUF4440 domain-containing protein [Ignavibacteria bacterium]